MASIRSNFEPTDDDVKLIREWLIKMPHIVQDYEDHVLKTLLRACKGSLQRAKKTVELINGLGFTHPHLFGHLDPLDEITQYYLDNVYLFVMPEKSDDDCIVFIAASKQDEVDPTKFSIYEMARFIFMSFLVLIDENKLGSAKVISIYDSQNTEFSKLKSVTPSFLKDFVQLGLSVPIRVQSSHHLNIPHYLHSALNFIKTRMSPKLADRMHFHSSMDELQEMIPKNLLPKEYGGDAGDLETLHNSWKRKVESYRDKLIAENNKMRSLDHLRPKSTVGDELQGSFRKLQVD